MKCCKCCTNTLDLGCKNPCGLSIDFSDGTASGIAGEWVLKYNFCRSVKTVTATLTDTEPVVFSLPDLNENFTYTVTITDPNGNGFTWNNDGIDYDCFRFRTVK